MEASEYFAEQKRIDEGVQRYIASFPVPKTLKEAILSRNFWIEEACRFSRNEDYYRGLLDQCAEAIGVEAYTADDGTVYQDEPVRAKIPQLVAALRSPADVDLRKAAIEDVMVDLYPHAQQAVAHLCDSKYDKSGALLGRVRDRAYRARAALSSGETK